MKRHSEAPASARPRGVTFQFTLIQSSYWSSYCILITFSSVYLLHQGFQNAQIGALISVSSILSALLQPGISRLADTLRRVSLRQFCGILVLMQLLCGALLGLLPGPVPQSLLYGLLLILVQLILPLCSALGMERLNRGVPLNFGVARGGGSLAFAVLSAALGTMVLRFGADSLPLALLAFNLILLLSVATFRRGEAGAEAPLGPPQAPSAPGDRTRRPFLLRYQGLPLLLFGVVCLFISHNVLTIFTYQIVLPLGGGSEEMGRVLFLLSIVELPVMFLYGLLLKKADSRFWVRISGVSFFLHTLGFWLAPNLGTLYAVQIFEVMGYALYTVASVYYINDIMSEGDRVQGQAYFAMTVTIGTVLSSLLGGVLLDLMGVSALLSFATLAGAVGMVLLFVLLGRPNTMSPAP